MPLLWSFALLGIVDYKHCAPNGAKRIQSMNILLNHECEMAIARLLTNRYPDASAIVQKAITLLDEQDRVAFETPSLAYLYTDEENEAEMQTVRRNSRKN